MSCPSAPKFFRLCHILLRSKKQWRVVEKAMKREADAVGKQYPFEVKA